MPTVVCDDCGEVNDLPAEALARGRYRCHACDAVGDVPPELRHPHEQPTTFEEPAQAQPNYVPSQYNTPEAMRQAEIEASRFGCLVALFAFWR